MHLWGNMNGARSWLHGDLGSVTVSGASRREWKSCGDEGEGEIKEQLDMDNLERALNAGLSVM